MKFVNYFKNLMNTFQSWDEKSKGAKYIAQKDLYTHFEKFPRVAKILWYGLSKSTDFEEVYEYKGLCYKEFSDLIDANPDNDQSLLAGFNYIKKVNRTLILEKEL